MNLHITNDSYGLYPVEIAKKIRESLEAGNNLIVNLYSSSVYKDDLITYISPRKSAFKKYISELPKLDKVIFHPYNITGFRFLELLRKKFPGIKVYWMCWSYELYKIPDFSPALYPFSATYVRSQKNIKSVLKSLVLSALTTTGLRKHNRKRIEESNSLVDYFCSPFYSDYTYLKTLPGTGEIKYSSIAYLSMEQLMYPLDEYHSNGDKIMVGHSALPDGNHFEVLEILASINRGFKVFLPLSYGDPKYADLIKKEAEKKFHSPEILERSMPRDEYNKKLTEVGWAIMNTKVQQGVGNIMVLVWLGVKLFLDKNTSTYKSLTEWGIHVFNIQDDLNEFHLSNKLSFDQVENNRKTILEKFNKKRIDDQWKEFLQ